MPFVGPDWRSPGDYWVRTSKGWEKMRLWRFKIFESINENAVARITRLSVNDIEKTKEITSRRQSYIQFIGGSTKERLELTSLSDAIFKLDMTGAVRDITRANYVTKLLILVLKEKLPSLSGSSQKLLFNVLESMVNEAIKSELNIGMMKDILECARDALNAGNHRHIGSEKLWHSHKTAIERLSTLLEQYQMKERKLDGGIMFSDLPVDCLRMILLHMADHKDLIHTGTTCVTMNEMTGEAAMWRQMCLFHFSNQQILTFLPKQTNDIDIDWKYIYKRCYKRFGKKDIYADMLALCSYCSCIYWLSLGHPCISEEPKQFKTLTPQQFLSLFKI